MQQKIKKIIIKKNKSKIVCLTAYSKNIASILDNHCDIILVGDSLGSVLYNYNTTRKVTLNTMIEHSKSVKLGVQRSLMVVDMPYNTYRNPKEALKNAKMILKKTKCDGVKLEGGNKIVKIIKYLIKNRIPVMGHLGILPQSEKGKFRFKGKKSAEHQTAAARVNAYFSGQVTSPRLYSVFRSQTFKLIWTETIKHVSDWGVAEIFPCALSYILGKSKNLPIFYASRELNESAWFDNSLQQKWFSKANVEKCIIGLSSHLSKIDNIKYQKLL